MTAAARGWAAIESGKISVRTVSPTRRAAIVNFLIAHRSLAITAHHDDAQIEEWWRKHCGRAEVVEVEIVRYATAAVEAGKPATEAPGPTDDEAW